ncbi:oxygen-independent coproporphyrinogen-3 oxidase [Dysgonomonas sp. PFB1-18]|uniref:radical SAM family heme chaperone HemW n=1 Tax=unclassified Dysgonomonas TaxID=2630389 RepID=UPI00247712F2|nr:MULTISPECIES: radical SAM family heme chaperone HemW [unclassified Dysgonomonas]MDH6309219.1 oxygen-independent coproporphyrinogen-3 oxidase [Dysgonomonas sp. PF1-14]MDH6338901.1 oxygen-independent coproporphyrinogen-3 oxidase [Dysgonomonas sp. PF1-16]MDH6380468.1 oxygen-independent coproporphyrinogen-3 oxidase [Dysgonomonas sp. PFB1-18]MDH6397729.1 oxygen-independent coproporphyrinogen-3 oxidase [Dysgonomonas sp. PF1-23]
MAGIYIHVPFCKTRCIYCDFYTRTDISPKKAYVSAVCKEIELRKAYLSGEEIKTIYFGGGTPSQLTYDDFNAIFEAIANNFDIVGDAEITMEANPDDLSPKYLETLQKLPFNRLSIGIQSFNDEELQFLKRRHSAQKAKEAVMLCKASGYDNISIDLMYGLPNQTMEIWRQNLEEAIALDIQHISSYHLIYEQGTRLFRLFKQGDVMPVDEDTSVDMFSEMIDRLSAAGFSQYEISNFARNELYSKHNSSYWLGAKYLGLGPAAHSYDGKNRGWNIASISKYIEAIDKSVPSTEVEYLDENTRYNDFILTGMRTMWGVNIYELEKQFGQKMKAYALSNVQKYIDEGFVSNNDNVLKLTREGIFISDGIMSDMMYID